MAPTVTPYAEAVRVQIDGFIEQLGEVVGTREYARFVEEAEAAQTLEEREKIFHQANVEAFRERGIPITEKLKVSPRSFEAPEDASLEKEYAPFKGSDLQSTVPIPEAVTVCGSVGIPPFSVSVGDEF